MSENKGGWYNIQVGCDVRDGDNHDGRVELEGLAYQPFLAYRR